MSDSVSTNQSADKSRTIRVGISTRHGMADEIAAFPPEGIEYCFPEPTRRTHRFIRSPLKCYLWEFAQKSEFDILEAYLSHRVTNASSEGFNSRIQSTNSAARGFRKFENYRIRILFSCGKLALLPELTQ